MVHAIKLTRRATSAASIALKAARTRRAMQPAGRPRTRGAKAAPAQADEPNKHEGEPAPTRGKYKRSEPTFRRPREVPGDTYDYIQDTDDDKKYYGRGKTYYKTFYVLKQDGKTEVDKIANALRITSS